MLFILRVRHTGTLFNNWEGNYSCHGIRSWMSLYLVGCERIRYMQRVVGTKEHSSPGGCVPALELSREEKGSRSQNVCYWPWFVRVPSSNHSSRPFLAHGRCNRTLRHFCQKCIVHSVCNLRPSPSPSHRIVSYRIAQLCVPSFTVRRVLRKIPLYAIMR